MTKRIEMRNMPLNVGDTVVVDGHIYPNDGFVAVYYVVDKVKPDHLHPEELLNGNYAVIDKEKTMELINK